jgi:hypothetical protein
LILTLPNGEVEIVSAGDVFPLGPQRGERAVRARDALVTPAVHSPAPRAGASDRDA